MNAEQVLLPDGKHFEFWTNQTQWTGTYHVCAKRGDDTHDGTEASPFRTIQRAAEVLKPGERVIIHEGVYREHVQPARGGEAADRMIGYHAAPNETVIIKGSEVFEGPWQHTHQRWSSINKPRNDSHEDSPADTIWHASLPREWFVGHLPFGMVNSPQYHMDVPGELEGFPIDQRWKLMLKRGLVFQDGKRLTQVRRLADLKEQDGSYYCEATGLDIHVRLFGDADPSTCTFEFTTREQAFAPLARGLSYIHVDGLTIEQVADGFTWPQRAALSATCGTHWIIENCTISQVNANGIDLGRQHPHITDHRDHGHHIVRRNTVAHCGLCGICGTANPMHNMLVEDNHIDGCGWHAIERMWESAAIKMHWTRDSLYRRNLVTNCIEAAGIWLDFGITNTRVTGNVVINTRSIFGGVFIEAAKVGRTMIDHNMIIGSKSRPPLKAAAGAEATAGGHGIYEHDCDRMIVAHNLLIDCQGNAMHMSLGQADRVAVGRGAVCRDHQLHNNLVIQCDGGVHFGRPHNTADGNVYAKLKRQHHFEINEPREFLDWEGWQAFHQHDANGAMIEASAETDINALTLTINLNHLPTVESHDLLPTDIDGNHRSSNTMPGPFNQLPAGVISLDPRHKDKD